MINRINIADDWYALLKSEFEDEYFSKVWESVCGEYEALGVNQVFPAKDNIFRAFNACPIDKLKVVILGQDPYHGVNQANGLSFSVQKGVKCPPSLKNIFKEVADCGFTKSPKDGDLLRWSEQGVLLLNSVLTVRSGVAASHAHIGWQQFTDKVITHISREKSGVVFMMWGLYAVKKSVLIDSSKHLVLPAVHPSPLSAYRGFFGCKHFKTANEYLKDQIEW